MNDALEAELIKNNGPDDPITVWKGKGYIVDGHRRYEICKKHKLPFEVREIVFYSIEEVKQWMETWQFVRRNLNGGQLAKLIQKRVSAMIAEGIKTTAAIEEVAAITGRSPRQVRRDIETGKDIEKIIPECRGAAMKARKSVIKKFAGKSPEEQRKALEEFTRSKDRTASPEFKLPGKKEVSQVPFEQLAERAIKSMGEMQKAFLSMSRLVGDHEGFRRIQGQCAAAEDLLKSWRKKL